jgi:hypothetical protein
MLLLFFINFIFNSKTHIDDIKADTINIEITDSNFIATKIIIYTGLKKIKLKKIDKNRFRYIGYEFMSNVTQHNEISYTTLLLKQKRHKKICINTNAIGHFIYSKRKNRTAIVSFIEKRKDINKKKLLILEIVFTDFGIKQISNYPIKDYRCRCFKK